MKILGDDIDISNDYIEIDKLKFLKDNPRVYACTHGALDFENLTEEEQQQIIYAKLKDEPSVKNLKPEIKRHGGLMESILIRHDTMEVIEGNSRLAVYRMLHAADEEGDWDLIPCEIVSGLTDRQQAAFLNQIHVKGKTQWSAYEKANFAYVRKIRGFDLSVIAKLFGESESTIRTRIKSIEMMKSNGDDKRSHFSYYDVIVRSSVISREVGKGGKLPKLLSEIKCLGSEDETNKFTAQDLRNKIPAILKKPKVLKNYQKGDYDLDEAYQFAKISNQEENIKKATTLLEDVSKTKLSHLEPNRFNAFKQSVRKLSREIVRIKNMIQEIEGTK